MATRIRTLLVVGLFALVVFVPASPGAAEPDGQSSAADGIDGRYIVLFSPGTPAVAETQRLERSLGFSASHIYSSAVQGFAGNLPESALDGLRRNPNVALIEMDQVATALPQSEPSGIRRIQADQNPVADIDNVHTPLDVDVAVIDTGSGPHDELDVAGGFASYGQCSGTWIEVLYCQAGLIAPTCGFTDSFGDAHGHGTHVAGTVAAFDNTDGVVGVAPGATIWSVRVLGPEGIGCYSDIIAGVDWVTANAATIEVANMSLGGPTSAALCTAIANSVGAGVTYAVAAGNSAVDAANSSPANCEEAIAVSAIADYDGLSGGLGAATCANYGPDDSLASFSNYGSVVDIAAPGVCIESLWLGNGYSTISGTSMATPHVAGAAALLMAENPGLSPQQVRATLLSDAFQPGSECYFSGDPDGFAEPLLNVGPACGGGGPSEPTVTVQQAAGQADPTNSSPVVFTVSFSEPVSGFDSSDVVIGGTAGANFAQVDGGPASYSVAVSGMSADGTVTVSVPAGAAVSSDSGLPSQASTGTDTSVTYDTTAPGVTLDLAPGQAATTSTSPINFGVVFSEPVSGFGASDITLGGTAGATDVLVVAGSASAYVVSVSGMVSDGSVTISFGAGAATDSAGNASEAPTVIADTVTFDQSAGPPPLELLLVTPNSIEFSVGMTVDVAIFGAGIAQGATVSFQGGSGPAPTVQATGVLSDGSALLARVTFKSGGPPRTRVWDVVVTNPDGSSDVLPGAFTVIP